MSKNPLVSVIVPIYNTEKFLEKCINSLINQTYKELEIILVNDASTDSSPELIDEFVEADSRVKRVNHDINRGLFQARITGVQVSKGEYVAFVDSDDYVSIDWFRTLVNKIEAEKADIAVGEWCFEYENGWQEYLNLDPFRIQDICLTGDEVLKEFMRQEGRCFSWHVVWNKLYSRSLWNQCEKDFVDFSNEHGHMLMWEDVAFSSGFWTHAQKVVNAHGVNYFYYKHSAASTSQFSVKNKKRGLKYINDSTAAIEFMKKCLTNVSQYQTYEDNYSNWITRCKITLYNDLVKNLSNKYYLKFIVEKLGPVKKENLELDDVFYKYTTNIEKAFEWLESIKTDIVSDLTQIVSFDVFDTLIERPFCEPTAIFDILSDEFNDLLKTSSYVDFKSIRIFAEKECRKFNQFAHPSVEEITLAEIYQYIAENFNFNKEVLDKTQLYEEQLEIDLCSARSSGKDLYELAAYCKKDIIICSDMYLSSAVINKILENSNYKGYKKLYLSSEVKLSKSTGHLFDYVCKDLNISKRQRGAILHIGDNWNSDIERARSVGMNTGHLSKAVETFKGQNPGIYAGDFYKSVLQNTYHLMDTYWTVHDFNGMSCVYGLIANKLYGNPYITINRNTDFNMNPYAIGYATLGPHLLALAQWIEKKRLNAGASCVHFVARDGYLVKKAYDYLFPEANSNYLRLSRKSLILADVNTENDIYSIFTKANMRGLSAKKIEEYLKPALDTDKLEKVHQLIEDSKIVYDRKIADDMDGYKIIKIYIENAFSEEKLAVYRQKLRLYFKEIIRPGDYIFDVGYNGRPEAALSSILGFPVNSFYIHTNKDLADKRQKRYGCKCENFYDYKPAITGVMREHLLMELGPSTIGYKEVNGTLVPDFENWKENYSADFVTSSVQNAAIDFVRDYKNTFEKYTEYIYFRNYDLSLGFEYFLHNSKESDRRIFESIHFEDDMAEGKTITALDTWNNEISQKQLWNNVSSAPGGEILPNLYMDGLFIKFYNLVNKHFPYGGRKRELIKKIARCFIH